MISDPNAVHNAAHRRLWRNRTHINNAYASWANSRVVQPTPPPWMTLEMKAGTDRGTIFPMGIEFTATRAGIDFTVGSTNGRS